MSDTIQPSFDFDAQSKHLERLQQLQYLHWTAFTKQWETDKKKGDKAAMDAAFLAHQKQIAARKIQVRLCFPNGEPKRFSEIIDPMLSAIYVTGLEVIPNGNARRD